MKANPGGQLAADDVIGRRKLIDRLWRALERQSVVLSAERRIGKTTIMLKMMGEAPKNKLVIYRDLEAIRTPQEFVETVLRDVEDHLSLKQKTAVGTRRLLSGLAGVEIASVVKLPPAAAQQWKTVLAKIVEDLVGQQEREVIFFWDEVPLMLHNVKRTSGEPAAMEVLDMLRSLRQTHPTLRMIFTGSIGLHNVLGSLRKAGYANDPTNDMLTEEVPPLSHADAVDLAGRILAGERIQAKDAPVVAEEIARATDGFPFFIHHVVDVMAGRGEEVTVKTVEEIIEASLTDPQDRWHLRYYRERLDIYYLPEERPLALGMLDVLAFADGPLSFDDLFNLLKAHVATEDQEGARDVLTLLMRDHYVLQGADGAYRFRFSLIRRMWRLHRGGAV
jgi:hypothetical protein